jgi:hypothetical protein
MAFFRLGIIRDNTYHTNLENGVMIKPKMPRGFSAGSRDVEATLFFDAVKVYLSWAFE